MYICVYVYNVYDSVHLGKTLSKRCNIFIIQKFRFGRFFYG